MTLPSSIGGGRHECLALGRKGGEPLYPAASVSSQRSIRINLLDATTSCGADIVPLAGRDLELAYCIAARERPVPRAQIISDVWPDVADDEDARNAFNVCLHRLRKRLGGRDAIRLTPYGYTLGADITTDLRALELFERSLGARPDLPEREVDLVREAHRSLARAEAPTRLASSETREIFERKIQSLKGRFAHKLLTLSLRSDRTAQAQDIALEMIRLDNCDESAWEIVIRAHLARNDRGAAIRDFRTYAGNISRELGLEPSHAIEALIQQSTETWVPAYGHRATERAG